VSTFDKVSAALGGNEKAPPVDANRGGGANQRRGWTVDDSTANGRSPQGAESIDVCTRDAWVARRLRCDLYKPSDLEACSPAFRPVAKRAANEPAEGKARECVITEWLEAQGDDFADSFEAAMGKVDPKAPPPADEPETQGAAGDDEPPWPKPIGGAALMGLAGDVVAAIDPQTEADPAAVLIQFLIGVGNLIDRRRFVHVDGAYHHCNLFGVVVGESSRARKGTSWGRVRGLLAPADEAWARRIMSGLSSGEGLVWQVRDPIHGTDKKTGEEIVVDAGVDDKRLLVVEGEFGGVLRVLSRDGNTLSAIIRQAYDGSALRFLTKNNFAVAEIAHVSICGHITHEELSKYLTACEAFNGLANRFLWCAAKRSKALPFGGEPLDDSTAADLVARIRAVSAKFDSPWGGGLSASGKRAWEPAYHRLTQDRPGLLGAVTSRAEAHCLRLAMLYSALDGNRYIDAEHVEAALEVWRYCDESAALLFSRAQSTGNPMASRILAALKASPSGLTRTDIMRGVFQNNAKAGDIDRALDLLINAGSVARETVATGGRSAERFRAA